MREIKFSLFYLFCRILSILAPLKKKVIGCREVMPGIKKNN